MSQLIYNSLFNDANLQAYWRLENGALVTDSGPNGYTLTNNNTVGEAAGRWGGAGDFGTSNTNKYLSISGQSFSINNQDNFSISIWAKSTQALADEEEDTIFSFVNNGYGTFYLRYYKPTGGSTRVDLVRNNGLTQESDTLNSDPGTSSWHHYVVVVSGTSMRFYADGVDQGSVSCSGVQSGSDTLLSLGSNRGVASFFDGLLDDIGIYNRVLTQAEVDSLYLASSPSASVSPSSSASRSVSPSASISPSASVSPSVSPSASISPSISPSLSRSPSASVSPSQSASPSVSLSISPSSSVSLSLSQSASPSVGYSDFSRTQRSFLPSDNADLDTLYTEQEETSVSSVDGVLVAQNGSNNYMIHQFKRFCGDENACEITAVFQSTLAPSSSPVYLQIYNLVTALWETIDSNNTAAQDTNFTMTKEMTDLTQYKGSTGVITCRVYQFSNS